MTKTIKKKDREKDKYRAKFVILVFIAVARYVEQQ